MHNSRAAAAVAAAARCKMRACVCARGAARNLFSAMICEGLHADERDCELDWCDRSQATANTCALKLIATALHTHHTL